MFPDTPTTRIAAFFVCASLFILCDALAAHWGKNNSFASLVAVIIVSPFAYISFGYLNQKYPLSIVSSWVVLAVCISGIVLGVMMFDDKLTMRQGTGLTLAICSIALMML